MANKAGVPTKRTSVTTIYNKSTGNVERTHRSTHGLGSGITPTTLELKEWRGASKGSPASKDVSPLPSGRISGPSHPVKGAIGWTHGESQLKVSHGKNSYISDDRASGSKYDPYKEGHIKMIKKRMMK